MHARLKFLVATILAIQFATLSSYGLEAEYPLSPELKAVCIYHPEPNWWGLARQRMRGRVVCQLTIDPKTGDVTEVKVLRKTTDARLNADIVMTAFKWKFRPGTITQTKVTFELMVKGYFKELH